MLGNVHWMWQRFFYHDSRLLEAQRQKRLSSKKAPCWSIEASKLDSDDDVFATIYTGKLKKPRII
jgi:putative beta-1,4-xylosyltransferase IRX10